MRAPRAKMDVVANAASIKIPVRNPKITVINIGKITTSKAIGAIKILAKASSISPSNSDLLNGRVDGRIIALALKKPVEEIKFMKNINTKPIPKKILIDIAK